MKGKQPLIALIPVIFSLHACKTQNAAEASKASGAAITQNTKPATPDSGITGKYWRVTELYGKKITVAAASSKEPHLILKTEGNRVTGHGGCNSFFGGYELKPGNRITFSQIGSTQMACPNMETESQLFQVLQTADNYTVNGDTLMLNKAKMAPLARLEAVYLK